MSHKVHYVNSCKHSIFNKMHYSKRQGAAVSIMVAAVLETLTADLLESASKEALVQKRQRIKPSDIKLVKEKDAEFNELLKGVTIVHGGVVPTFK